MATRVITMGLAAVIVILAPTSGFASDRPAAGHIVDVVGEVLVKRAGLPGVTNDDWIDATFGMPVYTGDLIRTGDDGFATVEMGNKSRTIIRPRASFTIRSLSPGVTDNRHWKQLADDLGVMLSTDERGATRGRLYVRIGDKWTAVALESPEEFLPDVLPLGH